MSIIMSEIYEAGLASEEKAKAGDSTILVYGRCDHQREGLHKGSFVHSE